MKFKNYIETESGIKDTSTSPGTSGQVLSSTVTGTSWVDQDSLITAASKLVVIACKNTYTGPILKGTPVYQTGTVGATDVIEVAPADALISLGHQPAIGLLQQDLAVNEFGNVVITGELLNFTTDPIDGLTPVTGQKVFLKSGGGLTLTKPTGEGNGIQNLGLIGKVSGGSAGSITVSSIMRTNDVPNLPTGKIWVGDGNTTVSDVVHLDEVNERMGIGTTSPSRELDIDGNIQLSDPSFAATRGLYGPNGPMITYNGLNFDTQIASGAIRINPAFQQMNFKVDGSNDFLSHDGSSGETIFSYQGSEKMRIEGNGNVGIGTTSPGYKLDVAGDMNVGVNTGFNTTRLNFHQGFSYIEAATSFGSGYLSMNIGSGEIYLSSGGNVGVGTSSPSHKLQINGTAGIRNSMISQPTYGYANVGAGDFVVGGNSIYPGVITLYNQDTSISAGQDLGVIQFVGKDDSSTGYTSSMIKGSAQLAAGSGSSGGGVLSFLTTPGYGGVSERMRINNIGNVGIGTTSPRTKLHVTGLTGDDDPALGSSTAPLFISNTANSYGLNVGVNNAGASWLQAQSNTSATAYEMSLNPLGGNVGVGFINPSYKLDVNGTGRFTDTLYYSSLVQQSQTDTKKDIRLVGKENSTIPIKEYKYKTGDNDKVRYGVMAEDVESTYPELVETDANGIKGVKYIDLLVRKIAELETEKRTLVNWRHYHSNTSYNTLYDSGMTTAFPYAYGSIPAPYDMYFTSVTLVNNPWSSYNKGPDGDTALFQAYVNGVLKYEVRDIRYGQNPYESITADFGKNVRLKKGESLKIRFYANGMWRYCNSTIILTEV